MRKSLWQLFFITFLTMGGSQLAQAQQAAQTHGGSQLAQTQQAAQAQQAAPATEASAQMASAAAGFESYADIAVLSQQIALSQRKIQAMELKNNLAALEAQQLTGTFPFKVVRVEGFGDTLYAILSDDAGVYYQVGPGDLVANQYRVSLIRPSAVGLYDINAHRAYAVPFALAEGSANSGLQENDSTSNVAAPVSTPAVAVANAKSKQ